MRRILLLTAAALAVAAALFTVAACGGSSGTGASPSPTGPAVVSHDTSSPAKALIGHWKDANAMDQYFDGSVWSTVTSGNERWKYGYLVQSEDAKKRVVVLKTFTIQADGSTDKDVEVITFHFLNEAMTQVQWGVGGVTADYVNGRVRP
jgi:hypothetical protein